MGLLLLKSPLTFAQGGSQYKLSAGEVVCIDVVGEKKLSFNELRLTDTGDFVYHYIGVLNAQGKIAAQVDQMIADKDLRRPMIAKAFQMPIGSPGLANLIAGTASLDDCIRQVDGLDVLEAGTEQPNRDCHKFCVRA